MSSLSLRASVSIFVVCLATAGLLFGPAGTFDYWQAWVFMVIYFVFASGTTIYLMKNDPRLLERRMRGGPFSEKEPVQKIIMSFASLGFIGLLVVPALDRRDGWSHLAPWMAIAGDAVIVLGWMAVWVVMRANTFAAATIQVAADQKVISTGPYALVRHPMYAGALVMLAGYPIALGSMWGFFVLLAILPALIWRLIEEEKFLTKNLPGYAEYKTKVRYRLIPFIW